MTLTLTLTHTHTYRHIIHTLTITYTHTLSHTHTHTHKCIQTHTYRKDMHNTDEIKQYRHFLTTGSNIEICRLTHEYFNYVHTHT